MVMYGVMQPNSAMCSVEELELKILSLSLSHSLTHSLTLTLSLSFSLSQAVYGVLSSIEGYDSFKDMLKHTQIGPWYFATQKLVKQHKATSDGRQC